MVYVAIMKRDGTQFMPEDEKAINTALAGVGHKLEGEIKDGVYYAKIGNDGLDTDSRQILNFVSAAASVLCQCKTSVLEEEI